MRQCPAASAFLFLVALGAHAQAAADPSVVPAPPTFSLSGRLRLLEGGKPAQDKSLDLRNGAVWFVADQGGRATTPTVAEMVTVKKQFQPQLLVVPVGSTVRFPNRDPILHNVFSVSGKNRFDLGLVGAGKGKSATFREAGLVRVFCNVHHAMFSHLLVVATPHFARLAADGSFRLNGIQAGAGQLHFWHERSEPAARALTVPHAAALALELTVSVPRVPPHKNKAGKSYLRGAYE